MGLIDDLKKRQAAPTQEVTSSGTLHITPALITVNNTEVTPEQVVESVVAGMASVYGPINPPESTVILPPEPDNVDQAAKPKRTRRTKAQIEADNALIRTAEQIASDTAAGTTLYTQVPNTKILTYDIPADAIQSTIDSVAAAYAGFTLFVDCLPSYECVYADHFITQANRQICEEFKVADYRMVEYKGPAMLSTIVLQLVQEAKPSAVYLDSQTPEGKTCLSSLNAEATAVVRGVR